MSITKSFSYKLSITQSAMKRRLLGILLRDRIQRECIREGTKIRNVLQEVAQIEWIWPDPLARTFEIRWVHRITV